MCCTDFMEELFLCPNGLGFQQETSRCSQQAERNPQKNDVTKLHQLRHQDPPRAHAVMSDQVVVQVMGLLSKNNQALRSFMQAFVLAPEGSVANKFYAYKDIFVTKPQEESDEEAQEPEERQQTPEVVPDDSGTFCDRTVSSDFEEHLEEPVVEPEPEPESELEQELEPGTCAQHSRGQA